MRSHGCSIERISTAYLDRVRDMANRRLRETYSLELFDHFYENLRQCFFVAVMDGSVEGFILAVPRDETALRVLMLVVDDGNEGKGIGRDLMETAEGYASSRKMGAITLEVGTSNDTAVGFYSKLGYNILGILNEYYEDRTDAFIMRKVLPS